MQVLLFTQLYLHLYYLNKIMSTLKEQTHEKHKEAEAQSFIKEIFQKRGLIPTDPVDAK